MGHYEALKVEARKKRERVIASARKEYNETLAKIDALRYLIEPNSGLEKPVNQLVQESIPEGTVYV